MDTQENIKESFSKSKKQNLGLLILLIILIMGLPVGFSNSLILAFIFLPLMIMFIIIAIVCDSKINKNVSFKEFIVLIVKYSSNCSPRFFKKIMDITKNFFNSKFATNILLFVIACSLLISICKLNKLINNTSNIEYTLQDIETNTYKLRNLY